MDSKAILEKLQSLKDDAQRVLSLAKDEDVEAIRIRFLAGRGEIARLSKHLPKLKPLDRGIVGRSLNEVKAYIEKLIAAKHQEFLGTKKSVTKDFVDVTLPGIKPHYGTLHPISKIIYEVSDIFGYLGFSVARGPEIELDEINFQKLRLDKTHPSRDTQETYYLNDEVLLRVHTSSVQIRYMEKHKPPIRIISPGRVYRRDRIDATHLPSFYQIEGLLVDKDSKLTDLLGTLSFFVKRLFGEDRKVRFYGHNFPYTEPSLEVEVQDKSGKWLEILGCGMVHPEVLANCNIDPEKYRGWAFGMGADRLAMVKYGITDIRLLYSGDLRFLNP